jgi:dihydrofolate reductase
MCGGFIDYWEKVVDTQPQSHEYPLAQLMVNTPKIVFSKTRTGIPGRNLKTENGGLATVIQQLKAMPGKDLLAYGGARLASSLISQNLVDEYYIFRCPVAIGSGMSIFKEQKILKLEETKIYTNGKVLNKYLRV